MNANSDLHPTAHLTAPPAGHVATILFLPGSLSPPTLSHLRLLYAARDTLQAPPHNRFVSGAYISPASSTYSSEKPGLLPADVRATLCKLAVRDVSWLDVATWECQKRRVVRTHEAVMALRDALSVWRPAHSIQVVLVAGADLVRCMRDTSKWPSQSVGRLRAVVDALVVKERDGDQHSADGLAAWTVVVVKPWVGDLSSSVVREHVLRGWAIDGMVADEVAQYIRRHGLFVTRGRD